MLNAAWEVSTAGSSLGTGGMSTKIVAARLATSAGVTTIITRASNPGNIAKIVRHIQATRTPPATPPVCPVAGHSRDISVASSVSSLTLADAATMDVPLHTKFLPSPDPIRDRSFWILHGLKPHGTVYIDAGAHRALAGKAGLLPVGVVDVEGSFAQQEAVRLVVVDRRTWSAGSNGTLGEGTALEFGRALVNYSSTEILRIKGRQSTEIEGLLGYADSEYVAPREYISFFRKESRPVTPIREPEGFVQGITEYESKASVA